MCTILEPDHPAQPLWAIFPFVMHRALMVNRRCILVNSSLGMRGSSVALGRSGHFPAICTYFLRLAGVTGPCCSHSRPKGAVRRGAMIPCIAVARMAGYAVAHFLMVGLGRLAFNAPCMPSDAFALLYHLANVLVVAVGMPHVVAMCMAMCIHLYGSA